MILWIVLTLMIAVAASGLTVPLVRRHDLSRARGSNVGVLQSQLAEIDAQLASGAIGESEAEGLRTEIKRRILSEGRASEAAPRPLPAASLPWVAIALVTLVALAATGLYATMGQPELTDDSAAPPPPQQQDVSTPSHPMGDVTAMIGQLEAKLRQSPNDSEGWRMLGWSYMHTNRAADAAKAYARAAALAPGNGDYLSSEGEALTSAANGTVTPDALKAFQDALAAAPGDPRARYFLALYKDQQGDHKGAMADWIALLKSAPPNAPWAGEVRDFVVRVARERGIDISKDLPPAPAATPAPPGPSDSDVAAASQMSSSDRLAMIHGMVDKLAADLKQNPHDADGWMRLMRARMVLGESDKAAAAYKDAQSAFTGNAKELAALHDAAKSLGIPGA